MWHQPCQRCKYTTSVDIQKTRYKKLVTRVQSHASAVTLLKRAENSAIKAIINPIQSNCISVRFKQNQCLQEKLPTASFLRLIIV